MNTPMAYAHHFLATGEHKVTYEKRALIPNWIEWWHEVKAERVGVDLYIIDSREPARVFINGFEYVRH